MADRPMRCYFWRVTDALDYLLTLARLRVPGALAGPEPETPADQQRERDRERVERAFPTIEHRGAGRRDLPWCRSLSGARLNRPPEATILNAARRTGAAKGGR